MVLESSCTHPKPSLHPLSTVNVLVPFTLSYSTVQEEMPYV